MAANKLDGFGWGSFYNATISINPPSIKAEADGSGTLN